MKEIKIKHCPTCGSSRIKKYLDGTIHCLKCSYVHSKNLSLEFKTYKEEK